MQPHAYSKLQESPFNLLCAARIPGSSHGLTDFSIVGQGVVWTPPPKKRAD